MMSRGEWMVGGSVDVAAERAFGFGPQSAAMVAAEAYVVAASLSIGVSRDEFVRRCGVAFVEGLRDVAGLPE